MRVAPLRFVALVATAVAMLPALAHAQEPACPCTVFAPTDAPVDTDALVD